MNRWNKFLVSIIGILLLIVSYVPQVNAEDTLAGRDAEPDHIFTYIKEQVVILNSEREQVGTLYPENNIYTTRNEDDEIVLQWGEEFAFIEPVDESDEALLFDGNNAMETDLTTASKTKLFTADVEFYADKDMQEPAGEIFENQIMLIGAEYEEVIEIILGNEIYFVPAEHDEAESENETESDGEMESISDEGNNNAELESEEESEFPTSDNSENISDDEDSPVENDKTVEAEEAKEIDKNDITPIEESSARDNEANAEEEESEEKEESELQSAKGLAKSITASALNESAAFTSQDKYFEVTQSNVTLYDNSSGSLKAVGYLIKGQIFKRVEDIGNWHKIKYGNKYGYVWKEATKPAKSQNVTNWIGSISHSQSAIAYQDLTVYDNSTGKRIPFGRIYKGSQFEYIKKSGDWLELEYGGRKGYVYEPAVRKEFTKDDNFFKVLQDNLTVFDNSTGSLVAMGELKKGSVYKRVSDYGNWHRIYFADKYGYVWEDSTTPGPRSAESNWTSRSNHTDAAVALSNLTVYDTSSGKRESFAQIDKGQKFKFIEKKGDWLEVQIGHRTGYVYADAVKEEFTSSDKYFEVLDSNVTIYDNSTGSLVSVGHLNKGESFVIKKDWGNWHVINYAGGEGYIWKEATRPSSAGKIPNLNKSKNSSENVLLEIKGTIYDNSNGKLNSFANVYAGEVYPFINKAGDWFIVDLGGRIGYLHEDAVAEREITTEYSYSFKEMVDIQMNRTPKADGAGKIAASRDLVEYYANPSNFEKGTASYLQFLSLSKSAGLNITETNQKILTKDKGTLAGQAAAFIEAGRIYNMNEIYLIAHALHETGNGQSTLAQGVRINGRTVYNMYGIAAYDDTPIESGSKYAYEQGWFTPEAAIIGGAKFVSQNYIQAGQDTLYKMRWNPDSPGEHQYATHVSWAVNQTARIQALYNLLEDHVMVFEIPTFVAQPGGEDGPTDQPDTSISAYPEGSMGSPTTGVNFRKGPSTGKDVIKVINTGTVATVLGVNKDGWFKIEVDGTVGWVSGGYFEVTNLFQVTGITTTLNVRSEPNTNSAVVGSLKNEDYISAVINNGKIVKDGDWTKVNFNGNERWVSTQYLTLQ
ncbi:SH3 domain-containing protein [Oceanobacillus massiliensis]|uniref:SH3 domain-containing protein n=1 Tax=Oceanobacillus massiliensis TaxID=1465765 RepID=UPI0030183C14